MSLDHAGVVLHRIVEHVPGALPDLRVKQILIEHTLEPLHGILPHIPWTPGQGFLKQGRQTFRGNGRRLILGCDLLEALGQFVELGDQFFAQLLARELFLGRELLPGPAVLFGSGLWLGCCGSGFLTTHWLLLPLLPLQQAGLAPPWRGAGAR